MLIVLEWNLWNSLRWCGRRAARTVLTNLFSTEVTSTPGNVVICLWHNIQSLSSTVSLIPVLWSDLRNMVNETWYLHIEAERSGGHGHQRGQELLSTAELQGLFSNKMASWYPPSGRGRASRENCTLSLGSEPTEKLIKGWDCRLEPEAVSTSRAPCSVSIITALSAGKISTLSAPASTLPDSRGMSSTYQSPIFIIGPRLFPISIFFEESVYISAAESLEEWKRETFKAAAELRCSQSQWRADFSKLILMLNTLLFQFFPKTLFEVLKIRFWSAVTATGRVIN